LGGEELVAGADLNGAVAAGGADEALDRPAGPAFDVVGDREGGEHDRQMGIDRVALVVVDRPRAQVVLRSPRPAAPTPRPVGASRRRTPRRLPRRRRSPAPLPRARAARSPHPPGRRLPRHHRRRHLPTRLTAPPVQTSTNADTTRPRMLHRSAIVALCVIVVTSAGCSSGAATNTAAGAETGTASAPHRDPALPPPGGSCHARPLPAGTLPDPVCTPGATDPHVTANTLDTTICRGLHQHRPPPTISDRPRETPVHDLLR